MTFISRLCCLLTMGAWGVGAHGGAAVVIQPVSATGAHTIVGSDIFLPTGGQRVRLEIRVAGWTGYDLKIAQVTLTAAGFHDGSPAVEHTQLSCPGNHSSGHSFCAQNFESGSRCQVGCPNAGDNAGCRCENGFQNVFRADYVGTGYSHVAAVDTHEPDYRYGITTLPPDAVPAPDGSLYLGTLFLTVPPGATGTYNIGIKPAETFMYDDSPVAERIPIDLMTAARIVIGPAQYPGSRYFTFNPFPTGGRSAVRVVLSSAYRPGPPVGSGEERDFTGAEGLIRWLGPPALFPDNAPQRTFVAAALQCTPYFTDWRQFESVQVYGDAVIPSSVYSIREVDVACEATPDDPLCFSLPQYAHTGQWGDAVAPFARSDQAPQPDAADIAAVVDGFRGAVGAVSKARTHLRGKAPAPQTGVNFGDVDLAADAVRGMPYQYPVPSPCP